MKELIRLQQKIAPGLIKVVERRYNILRTIFYSQPIGRRRLAEKIGVSERKVRNDLDFLKERYLVNSTSAGTKITETGKELFYQLDNYIRVLRGLDNLESKLKHELGLKEVYIVPGSEDEAKAQQELGRRAARLLKEKLENNDVLAVNGGTTLAAVADFMLANNGATDITVVPARGGLGEEVEIQANTIAAQIANKLGGRYRLLHLPDNLDQTVVNTLIQKPQIKEVLNLAKEADILIHGIGTAEVMARRRQVDSLELEKILEAGAVGEAFGYYFNQTGEIVYSTTSLGVQLEDLKKKVGKTIAVAGGKKKAGAIISVVSDEYQDMLITDREAAEEILDLLRG
ncbi:sugar-binding transcriptional regulator [Acetohalobium arabaticum]|uniref:Transcriptional regulator, DeoR family n=1 Tax=Acetohalobium arabaticum (strain ATCC 49924 / DSM 5501 / Z-7288) TaxID=574087 RepID=D9QU77_ACEAZ|nr:sugar-binding domain-containing protein [Acetohalobium arabaticum]ADL11870.1 transcriptional regulator, DeoR family [Acetohalobium arabaticum DSM 5501]